MPVGLRGIVSTAVLTTISLLVVSSIDFCLLSEARNMDREYEGT